MGVLDAPMKLLVERQRLGFVATVCPDGTPNLSPKGTTVVWDDDHLVFADIHSPGTVANLRSNPAVEINVVDVMVRKGYRFKGTARVLGDGVLFDEILTFLRKAAYPAPSSTSWWSRSNVPCPSSPPPTTLEPPKERFADAGRSIWRSLDRGDATSTGE